MVNGCGVELRERNAELRAALFAVRSSDSPKMESDGLPGDGKTQSGAAFFCSVAEKIPVKNLMFSSVGKAISTVFNNNSIVFIALFIVECDDSIRGMFHTVF